VKKITRGQTYVLISGSAIRRRKFYVIQVTLDGRSVVITRAVLERMFRGSPPTFFRKPVTVRRVYVSHALAGSARLRLISTVRSSGYLPAWRIAPLFNRMLF